MYVLVMSAPTAQTFKLAARSLQLFRSRSLQFRTSNRLRTIFYVMKACTYHDLRLPFTLSGVFSFSYVTPLIRIGYPQTYISVESLWNYLNGETFV